MVIGGGGVAEKAEKISTTCGGIAIVLLGTNPNFGRFETGFSLDQLLQS